MLAKIIVVVLLLAIVTALMTSMVFLVKDPSNRRRTLTGLKIRVALSLTLIGFIVLAYFMGWIEPHGVYRSAPPAQTQQPSP